MASDIKQSPLEQFLKALETKTNDKIHLRLLKASRGQNPSVEIEAEFKKIISEIVNENKGT